MLPKVSLITTVYNRASYLPLTLDSILAQTYRNFELLIWDDASTDHSLEIAHRYAQKDSRIRVMAASHQGLAPSLKDAIAQTTAPYLGWVDSDDLLAPTALAETTAILDTQPTMGMVYTNHLIIDDQGNDKGLGRLSRIPYSKERLLTDFITFHFRLMRRSVYEQVGGIDPTFTTSEDYDLCLRLSEVTDIAHLPRPLYYYRRHSSNSTNNPIALIESTQRAISNTLQRRGLDTQYDLKITPSYSLRPKPHLPVPDHPPIPPLPPSTLDPLVSIIIPAYNAAPRLHLCLKSCLQQTYSNLEILLVDNGSTDDTVAIAQAIAQTTSRPIHILHCPERGANYARNFGFAQAQGDYIQWLDADDELAPDKLARQVLALVQQPDGDIAYGDWDWCFWQKRELVAQLRFADRPYDDLILQSLLDNWRPPHTYLLRRRAALRLHQIQAWNPETRVYMDREYFTIAALLGLNFLHVPNSLVCYHRWSGTQVSRRATVRDRIENRQRIFRRFQDIGHLCQGNALTSSQRFLLQQNWELWLPAFTLEPQDHQTWVLYNCDRPESLPLTWQEATIAHALLQSTTPRVLEDHARKVIQILWLQILIELRQGNPNALDYSLIADKLAWRVGCRQSSTNHLESEPEPMVFPSTATAQMELHPLLQEVPLFTPLLGEERFVVQHLLEQLRQRGFLQTVEFV